MPLASAVLRTAVLRICRWIGVEGAFVTAGTAVLAAGAALLHPAGPYVVIGLMLIAYGFALAIPRRG